MEKTYLGFLLKWVIPERMVPGASNLTVNLLLLAEKQIEPTETESEPAPVFAKLPSEQELSSGLSAGHAPVVIHLPGNVWIEIGTGCPGGLLASLLHALKAYA